MTKNYNVTVGFTNKFGDSVNDKYVTFHYSNVERYEARENAENDAKVFPFRWYYIVEIEEA